MFAFVVPLPPSAILAPAAGDVSLFCALSDARPCGALPVGCVALSAIRTSVDDKPSRDFDWDCKVYGSPLQWFLFFVFSRPFRFGHDFVAVETTGS